MSVAQTSNPDPRPLIPGPRSAPSLPPRSPAPDPRSLSTRLFTHGHAFDFFQAVRLLQQLNDDVEPIGYDGPPNAEPVRLRSQLSLAFPAGQIAEISPATPDVPVPSLSVTFFGLNGVNGALPRYYTEMLLRIERDTKHSEKRAAREWFDLFNHRLLSLFYRSWAKYRFYLQFERREYRNKVPDAFTQALLGLVGLGQWPLRNRLQVSAEQPSRYHEEHEALAELSDLTVLFYGGLFAQRARNANGLSAMLADYFRLPVEVRQFQGEWLSIDPADCSRLGAMNCGLGRDVLMGDRVWDVEGKIRIRIGPLGLDDFSQFLPDRTPVAEYKTFFLLAHLVRLYIGPSLDFDVQLLLKPDAIPPLRLGGDQPPGARLGWNTWLQSAPGSRPVDDAVFAGREVFWLNEKRLKNGETGMGNLE